MTDTQQDEVDKLAHVLMEALQQKLGVRPGETVNSDVVVTVVCALGMVAGHIIGMCQAKAQGDLFRVHTQVTLDVLDDVEQEAS